MRSDVPSSIVIARRLAGGIFIVSLIIVLIGIALLANWYRTRPVIAMTPLSSPASAVPSGTTPSSSPPSSQQSKPPRKPTPAERERAALAQLKKLAARDFAITDFEGEWAAQVSSKYVGVKDPRQVTASGSHIFKAVDILAEHNALRKKFSVDHDVRLLRGQDFYPHKTPKGRTIWYTFVLGGFGSVNDVKDFCAAAYPNLSGDSLMNRCRPRTLRQ